MKIINLKINWPKILAFVVFWSYAWFGQAYFESPILETAGSVVLTLVFVFFLYKSENEKFQQNFKISPLDIKVLFSFAAVFFLLSWKNLFLSLTEDNIYHAQYSLAHFTFLVEKLFQFFPQLGGWVYKDLLHLSLALFFIGVIVLWRLWEKLNFALKIWSAAFLFLAVRLVMVFYGGILDPHPPLRFFPSWLMTTIFGPSDWAFRAGSLVGLVLLVFICYKFALNFMSKFGAYLFALCVGSLPLLWHIGTILQPSLWAVCCFTLVIFYLFTYKNFEENYFFATTAIIAIFTLMRQSSFIGLALIFLPFLLYAKHNWKSLSLKDLLITFSPVLVLLPLTLKTALVGTPASYVAGEVSYFGADANLFTRLFYAVKEGIVLGSWLHALTSLGIFLVSLALLISLFKKSWVFFFSLLLFLATAFVLFFSIRPVLWGMGRYAAEYMIPLVIFGLFLGLLQLRKLKILGQISTGSVLGIVIVFNFYFYFNLPSFNVSADAFWPKDYTTTTMLSEYVYNYRDAFAKVKLKNLEGNTYVAGVSYGVFPEILNSYTVKQTLEEKAIFNETGGVASAQAISNNQNIKLVLVSDLPFFENKQKLIRDLQALGFHPWESFFYAKYGSTIVGLIRE